MVILLKYIAKNINFGYNMQCGENGGARMNMSYVSPFDVRQVMQENDFEIFHRLDRASGSIEPHSHDFFEIFFPRTEGIEYAVEGQRYRLSPGMVVMVPPGETHFTRVSVPGLEVERFILWLDTGFVESLTAMLPRLRNLMKDGLKGRHLIVPDAETYELMIELLFSLLHEKKLNDVDSASLSRLVVAQLLIHMSRVLSSVPGAMNERTGQRYRDVMQVYDYISAHLKEPMTVTSLAEMFFFDKNTLTRKFKHVTGMTPGECIRRKRLDAAYAMITRGAGMAETCRECGFADYSAFYRAFRNAYGVSPSECEKSINNEQ